MTEEQKLSFIKHARHAYMYGAGPATVKHLFNSSGQKFTRKNAAKLIERFKSIYGAIWQN